MDATNVLFSTKQPQFSNLTFVCCILFLVYKAGSCTLLLKPLRAPVMMGVVSYSLLTTYVVDFISELSIGYVLVPGGLLVTISIL